MENEKEPIEIPFTREGPYTVENGVKSVESVKVPLVEQNTQLDSAVEIPIADPNIINNQVQQTVAPIKTAVEIPIADPNIINNQVQQTVAPIETAVEAPIKEQDAINDEPASKEKSSNLLLIVIVLIIAGFIYLLPNSDKIIPFLESTYNKIVSTFKTNTTFIEDETDAETLILNGINGLNDLDNFQMTLSYNYSVDSTTLEDETITSLLPNKMSTVAYIDLKNNINKITISGQLFNQQYNATSYQDLNTNIQYSYDNINSTWSKSTIESSTNSTSIDITSLKDLILPNKTYIKVVDNEYEVTLTRGEYFELSDTSDSEDSTISDSATYKVIYQLDGKYISKIETVAIDGNNSSTITVSFLNYNNVGDISIPQEAYNVIEEEQ